MKKLLCLLLSILLCFIFCSCEETNSKVSVQLTKIDKEYIKTIYNSMSYWDTPYYDSGSNHYINKIAFFDFDGTNNIVFYTYCSLNEYKPTVGFYCTGYYVSNDGITRIDPDIYDSDTSTRHSGCKAKTYMNGIDWNHNATDKEKHKTIKKAYIDFLKTNIYND